MEAKLLDYLPEGRGPQLSLRTFLGWSISTPIRRIRSDCCARAASGHVTAALPRSVMNWRRLMSSMGSSPEPAVPAYRRLRMFRKRPQVLGADLNCSER